MSNTAKADARIEALKAALIQSRKMFMYITESTRLTSAQQQAQQGVNVVDDVLAQDLRNESDAE